MRNFQERNSLAMFEIPVSISAGYSGAISCLSLISFSSFREKKDNRFSQG